MPKSFQNFVSNDSCQKIIDFIIRKIRLISTIQKKAANAFEI